MFTVDTCIDAQDRCWIVIRRTAGAADVFAHIVEATYCNHDRGRCLVDPPRWTYWLGGHYRYSLGGLLWKFGQWVTLRNFELEEVRRIAVDRRDLEVDFGWGEDELNFEPPGIASTEA